MSKLVALDDLKVALGDVVQDAASKAVKSYVDENTSLGGTRTGPEPTIKKRGESVTRDRRFDMPANKKGIAAGRFVRALAFAKGDTGRAAAFCKKAFDDELGEELQRAFISGELTPGGALIPPEYAAEIIELLRARSVVRAAGARTLPMPNGSITLRRQTGTTATSYVGESQDIGVGAPTTDLITLTSKKLAAIVPISNDLLQFTSGPSADEFVRDDLVMTIATREDQAFLRDDGTLGTPRGIVNWAANSSATNGTSATNIEDDFKDLINNLESADIRLDRPAWFMHPRSKNHLRNLRDANGNLIFPEIRAENPTVYGYPVMVSTNIPVNLGGGTETEIIFADMVHVLIGEAMDLEITASGEGSYVENATMKSAFSRDEMLIRAITKHDLAVRHDEAVALKTAVVWGA